MAQQISAEQIQKAEQMVQARMASDPAFSVKMRNGQIKFLVEPGDKFSQIVIVDMTNTKNVEKYGGRKMFNTPQEAEHFTEGFGRQPTREGGVSDIVSRATMPRYQHQINDPLRKYSKSPAADAVQDILSTGRYATPIVGTMMGKGPLPIAAITGGLGLATKGVGAITGEEELQETLPNVITSAVTAGASAYANKVLSEDAVRNRQLRKVISNALNIPTEQVTDNMIQSVKAVFDPNVQYQGPYKEGVPGIQMRRDIGQALGIKPEAVSDRLLNIIQQPLAAGNLDRAAYTYGDWRRQPLREFDTKFDAEQAPVRFKKLPMPRTPGQKAGTTGAKVLGRRSIPKFTQQQWDAVARQFMTDAGIPHANPNDVIAFIKEAWLRPQSEMGVNFYPTQQTKQDLPKKEWTRLKATEQNPVASHLYQEAAYFDDPKMNVAYQKALGEYKKRYKKIKGKENTPIITQAKYNKYGQIMKPSEYEKTGSYDIRLPFLKRGNEAYRVPMRGLLRGGATIAPLAIQALAPYVIKALPEGDE